MRANHDNPKDFDKRSSIESKKAKDLASAMEKVKKSLEGERKTYAGDFKKHFQAYSENVNLSPQLSKIVEKYVEQLEILDKAYEKAINHISDVSCNALGYLPKKYESYKKSIVQPKLQDGIHKLKDFEFDRIEYTSKALLHFFNAQMHLHAQALQIYSDAFQELAQHNEGEDVAMMYNKSEWAIQKMKDQGYKINK